MTVLADDSASARDSTCVLLGDPEDWITDHGDVLLRFAIVRVGDRATAEDLVQETLLSAWRGRASFDGACTPRTWFVSILKRRVADYFRRVKTQRERNSPIDSHPSDLASDACGSAEKASEAAEFWSIVTGCTSDLPEHLARAFRLRTFGDEAPESICDTEGITRKNLSVRLHRARQLLRLCLERRWFGEATTATGPPAQ